MKNPPLPVGAGPCLRLVAITAISTHVGGLALAQTNGTWNVNSPGNWSNPANWSGGNVASGATSTANFGTVDITGDHLVSIDSPFTIGTLVAEDATTPGNNWTFGGPGTLTLDNGGGQPVLNAVNGTHLLSAPLAGTNGFGKTGAGTMVLGGGGTMTGNVVVSAGTLQLGADNGISNGAGIDIFGGASASRILDLNGYDQTLSQLVFTATNVAGNLTVNGGAASTLTINTTTNTELGAGGSLTASNRPVTVDMSGLGEFVWNGAANTFRVGLRFGVSNSSGTNPGTMTTTLADKNTLTAVALAIGTQGASNNGGTSLLSLGQTNTLNANTINVGTGGRTNATLDFRSGLTSPAVTIRGTDGSSRVANWTVGLVAHTANSSWTGVADFSAGEIDALVTNLKIGLASTGTQVNRLGTENATFTMGKGTLDVTTLTVGQYVTGTGASVAGSGTYAGNGTFNLGDAAGIVKAETLVLADNIGTATGAANKIVSGTFNLNDGTLEAKTIGKGADTGNANTRTRTFNFAGGTLRNYAGSDLSVTDVPITFTGSGPRTFEATAGQSITVASTSGITGTGGFTKTGTGTLNLQGGKTYTGSTDVQAGTLALSNSLPAGPITVDASATLELANVTLAGQPALDIDGNLNLTGPVTVVAPLSSIPGTISGVLQYGSITGTANLSHNYRSASFNAGATSADLNVALGAPLTWTGAGGNSWDLNSTVSWKDASDTPQTFLWADSVTFDSTGSGTPTVNLAAEMQPASVTVTESAVDYVFSGSGFISGPAGLTKNGAAKLTITTGNTNTGTTTVNAGTLEIGNGGTTGWMGGGDIANNGSLVFNRSNSFTVANAISGSGTLTKLGAGTMTVTADNSFAGGTTISEGTILVGDQSTTGSLGTGTIVNDGVLRLNRADGSNPYAYTFANDISGTGGVEVGQSGTGFALDSVATVSGNNSFTGNINVRSGGLRILSAAALGTGPKTIIANNGSNGKSQFYLDGSGGNITVPSNIVFRTSTNDINRPAIGNLAGDNVIQGTITLTAGGGDTMVKVVGGSLTLNGQITTSATSIRYLRLAGAEGSNGTINGTLVTGNTTLGVVVVGPNTWTLTNSANDYTGSTSVNGGTLALGAGNVLPDASNVVIGAGTLNAATFTDAVGTLDVSAAATIHLGTGAALAFANSSAVDWTGGTLAITGTFVPGNLGSLRFGTDNTGLTVDQLSQITATGWTGFALDANGYLTATPVGGGDYDTWAGGFGLDPLTDGAPGFDKDGDGLTNEEEYAFGLDPTSGSSVAPITLPLDKASGTFTYTRRVPGLTGLTYTYESSTTLGGWTTFTPVSEVSDSGSPVEEITVTVPAALLTGDRRFVRVQAN